ncbi:hypothetical protein [Vibrio superstes]|uniref:DUF11 domain-containing protein n=1 Tax=Vibrio superstes NBRC 103154 TaxID=1219062 RepID=A0A511QVS0_9VIBR|nr:hypothetical protein [Vibrio superstes]GEM81468.1 hypothetical protein VSU01S_37130 [Vibrio superstes NBRC 103154]
MDISRFKMCFKIAFIGLVLSMYVVPSYAVHELDVFELDGDAVDDPETLGDDWDTITTSTTAVTITDPSGNGVLEDPAPRSIFTGGRKDIQDISQWGHKNGSVPDKDDLTNAYAAAYGVDNGNGSNDLVIYFGADRFANVGDAFMGFWFFQDKVAALPDGSFSGSHKPGDVLILIDYPQGANDSPYAALLVWDPTCPKAASNDPQPPSGPNDDGDCAAKNLRLKAESNDEVSAECGANESDDNGCAITNGSLIDAPWGYVSKTGIVNEFPFESFYEGGVNLTQLLGGTGTCFSSFMAETRSSSSFTASLKDFVLGEFDLCGLKLTKTCDNGTLSPSGDSIIYDYTLTVKNTGFGPLHDIMVRDITAEKDYSQAILLAGQEAVFTDTFISPTNGILNEANVTAALVSGGPVEVSDNTDFSCPAIPPTGSLSIDKSCETVVENRNGQYGLLVNYSGMVCNTSLVKINNVVITESHDGIDKDIPIGTMAPGACASYGSSYVPTPLNGENLPLPAGQVRTFTDTVQAAGTTALFGEPVDSGLPVEASCPICI